MAEVFTVVRCVDSLVIARCTDSVQAATIVRALNALLVPVVFGDTAVAFYVGKEPA